MRHLITILLALSVSFGWAQTQPNLPTGAQPYGNQLFKDLQGNIWTGRGPYINLGSWHKVDSLLALKADASDLSDFYTQSQIDAFLALKADASALADFYTKAAADVLLAGKVDKTATITNAGGLDVGGSLASGNVSIGLNDTYLNNRYLRKDANDETDNTLTVAELIAEAAEVTELQLPSLATMASATDFLVLDGSGKVGKKQLDEVSISVANSGGTVQFPIGNGDALRFQGTGDASVSFNPSTKMVTINSVPGSGTGGAVTSFNGRDGAVVAETGDYSTTQVTEGSNQYFTQARVRATPITGYAATNSVMVSTDNIVQALGKAQGQINARALASRTLTVSGTAGRIVASGGAQNLTTDREWTLDLAPSGIAAGAYTKPTFDAYGRATGGASLAAGDIPNLPAAKITSGTIATARLGGGTANSNTVLYGDNTWGALPSIPAPQTLAHNTSLGASLGNISISGGNTIYLSSIIRNTSETGTWDAFTKATTSGLKPFASTTGSTGFPSTASSGFIVNRNGSNNVAGAMALGVSATETDVNLYMNVGLTSTTWAGWKAIADKDWVTSQLPTDYVNTTSTQTGIAGNKGWTGSSSWSPGNNSPSLVADNAVIGGTANGPFVRLTKKSTSDVSAILRGYSSSGVQLELSEGGINVPVTSTVVDGPYRAGGNVILGANNVGQTVVAANTGSLLLRPNGVASNEGALYLTPQGEIRFYGLSTGGTQMVVADNNGVLSKQSIPTSANNGTLTLNTGTGLSGSASFSANQIGNTSFTVAVASGYSIPTNTQIGNWNTAYGWGDYRQFGLGATIPDGSWNFSNSSNNYTSFHAGTDHGIPGHSSNMYGVTLARSADFGVMFGAITGNRFFGKVNWQGDQGFVEFWTSGNFNPSNYQTIITGAASTIVSDNLITGRAVATTGSGKIGVSVTTATELAYLSGATSNIQTQLNSKVATSRTINGKALSANVTLTAADVSAMPTSWTITAGNGLSGGGNGTANRTLHVAAGDGISVSSTNVAVDGTVARRNATNTFSGANTFSQPVTVANATASNHAVTLSQMNAAVRDNVIIVDSLFFDLTDDVLPAQTHLTKSYAVTGVIPDDVVVVNNVSPVGVILTARVSAAGTIQITAHNPYTTNLASAPFPLKIRILKYN